LEVVEMKKSTKLLSAISVFSIGILAATSIAIGLGNHSNEGSAKPGIISKANVSRQVINSKDTAKYKQPSVDALYAEVRSIDDAKKEISFTPRIPKPPAGIPLLKVQVHKFPKEQRGLRLDYGNIIVLENPSPNADDYDANAKEYPDIIKKVQVNGFPGIEIEQGYQDLPNGSKHHYPTVVSWFENGARYTVYSQSANLNEIRAFAKTMFE